MQGDDLFTCVKCWTKAYGFSDQHIIDYQSNKKPKYTTMSQYDLLKILVRFLMMKAMMIWVFNNIDIIH